ncbi:MAG: GNAT family N-acetyltransferase [Acidobacteria bacterium]|nr:GNAT family N-acetyltransferase [Acidobacteriota bacterium]
MTDLEIQIVIRDARLDDAEVLSDLLDELGRPTPAVTIVERMKTLDEIGNRVLVAELNGDVVGLLTLHQTPNLHAGPDGRITALVVRTQARNLGIATRLVQTAEAICREWKCHRMEVMSASERLDAHRLYEQLGYRETRKRFRKELEP